MLVSPSRAHAIHQLFTPPQLSQTIGYTVGTAAGLYLLSEMAEGPAVLSVLYTSGSIYLMNDWFKADNELLDLVVPFGMLTMGIVNAVLLGDEAYSNEDVLIYNAAGIALIVGYAAWTHATGSHPSTFAVSPLLHKDGSGLLLTKFF